MIPDYDRAARLAYKSLIALGINAFPVRPLEFLSVCRNTAVHTYEEAMLAVGQYDYAYFKFDFLRGQDAVTFRRVFPDGKTAYEVLYDSQGDRRRQRFTLAHELGHIVMNHTGGKQWEEKEADYFASQLLAPVPVCDLFTHSGVPLTPDTISAIFGLSKAASEIAVLPHRHRTDPDLVALLQRQFEGFVSSCYSVRKEAM